MHRYLHLAGLLAWLLLPAAQGEEVLLTGRSAGMGYRLEAVARVDGIPWGLAFVDAEQILFTLRAGGLGLLNTRTGALREVTGGPTVRARGQGGLLDVVAPPGYRPGAWLYFTYSKPLDGRGATTLARAHLAADRLTDWQELLVTRSASDTDRHYGSRIAFDDAGHLFVTVGERGHRPYAQDLSSHAGSVLRLRLDGGVPPDNPFVGRPGARAEIWSYGHRNPQGIAYDTARGRLWEIEHGPRGGDELNLIRPGRNYGWPVVSYGQEYWGPFQVGEGTTRPGMEPPVKVYIPSIAPGSLLLYRGASFPGWRGDLFAGALKLTHLNRIRLDDAGQAVGEERLLQALGERIRALAESPEGWLYLSTDSGRILRLRPDR